MKKIVCLLPFLLLAYTSYSQSKYFIGVNAGFGFTSSNSVSSVGGSEVNIKPSFILPALAGVIINDKSRVWLSLVTIKDRIEHEYRYNATQPDPILPSHSEASVKASLITINYDRRLAATEQFEVYASAGVRRQWARKIQESTTYGDGRKVASETLRYDTNRNLLGLGTGIIAKYNITEKQGITFSPDYSYYFGSFNKDYSNNLKRLSLTIGTEIKF